MCVVVVEFIRLKANVDLLNAIPLKCISINNPEYKARPVIMNVISNELLFYPYSILVNKCSSSCNNINDPFAKLCNPDVLKT